MKPMVQRIVMGALCALCVAGLSGCVAVGSRGIAGDAVLEAASVGTPFRNSVGMSFVPVPVDGLGYTVLMAQHEVTVDQWKAFGRGYNAPGFSEAGNHPAVNVSWEEAKAYCEWLSKKEGRRYRLPTDHEWSCAVGIGGMEDSRATPESKSGKIPGVYPWGSGWRPPGNSGNYPGEEWLSCSAEEKAWLQSQWAKKSTFFIPAAGYSSEINQNAKKNFDLIKGHRDGHLFTAPVGSCGSNRLGIFDLGGNVSEWCEDNYSSVLAAHVLRGGSWDDSVRDFLLSSNRSKLKPGYRGVSYGFRLACDTGSTGSRMNYEPAFEFGNKLLKNDYFMAGPVGWFFWVVMGFPSW